MSYIQFDPRKHKKGARLYEEQVRTVGGMEEFFMVAADVTWEEAVKTPWYYYVVKQ